MAFIIFFLVKKFEKVEKTGFFRAKSFFHCTLSLILGMQTKQAKMVSISTYEMTGGRRILWVLGNSCHHFWLELWRFWSWLLQHTECKCMVPNHLIDNPLGLRYNIEDIRHCITVCWAGFEKKLKGQTKDTRSNKGYTVMGLESP